MVFQRVHFWSRYYPKGTELSSCVDGFRDGPFTQAHPVEFSNLQSKTQPRSGGRMLPNAAETFTIIKESALEELLLLLSESNALSEGQGHLTGIEYCFLADGMLGQLPRCYF